ncbi:MAG TPA: hypothetical protein VMB46_01560 [Methanomassiliicoccales archaeon]|nr:hypothetical protein [Methanomassiliicoccales archaeon]
METRLDAVPALELAQVGEERCHLAGGVLVDLVQAHEGVGISERPVRLLRCAPSATML